MSHGVNGWMFDASRVEVLAECLAKVAGIRHVESRRLREADRWIQETHCPTEAAGRGLAALLT